MLACLAAGQCMEGLLWCMAGVINLSYTNDVKSKMVYSSMDVCLGMYIMGVVREEDSTFFPSWMGHLYWCGLQRNCVSAVKPVC